MSFGVSGEGLVVSERVGFMLPVPAGSAEILEAVEISAEVGPWL